MRIKSVAFSSLGPFAYPSRLELDKDLTVITGANDCGKSKIVRGLELLLINNSDLKKEDVNRDRLYKSSKGWENSNLARADVEFIKTDSSESGSYIVGGKKGDVIKHQYSLHDKQRTFS